MHPDEARDRWKVSYGNIQSSPITFHRGKPSTCNAAHQVQAHARLDTIRLAHGLGPYRLGVRRALGFTTHGSSFKSVEIPFNYPYSINIKRQALRNKSWAKPIYLTQDYSVKALFISKVLLHSKSSSLACL